MKADTGPLRTRTARSATALLLAGGMLLSGNAVASALDLGVVSSLQLGSAETTPLDPTPVLASIPNFRDVAGNDGPGYTAAVAAGPLNRGVIYRSNALSSASEDDLQTLASLNITHVYDLRGAAEIANPLVGGPDRIPPGADYTNIPIEFGDLITLAQTIESPEAGRQFMEDTNRGFVTDPAHRAGFKQVLTEIAQSSGPVLFHCSAGKDRAGWVTAILQTISGVPPETVMNDYLLSNDYLAESNARTLAQIRGALGDQAALNLEPVLAVEQSYIEAGFTQLNADYGGVFKYLRDGLGLSEVTIGLLVAKLAG